MSEHVVCVVPFNVHCGVMFDREARWRRKERAREREEEERLCNESATMRMVEFHATLDFTVMVLSRQLQ